MFVCWVQTNDLPIPGQNLKMSIVPAISSVKWMLILVSSFSNNTLVWKIVRRKHLQSVFNLSMCFYFLWSGVFAPLLIYEYGNLLEQMITLPGTSCPTICLRVTMFRVLSYQARKVFIINIVYR